MGSYCKWLHIFSEQWALLFFQCEYRKCPGKEEKFFFYINIKYYNICYILLYFNYYATLQGRCQEEQKTMSTPWPTHENTQLNQQLNKHLQNGTHTNDTDGYWNLFRIGMQGHRRRRWMPNNGGPLEKRLLPKGNPP